MSVTTILPPTTVSGRQSEVVIDDRNISKVDVDCDICDLLTLISDIEDDDSDNKTQHEDEDYFQIGRQLADITAVLIPKLLLMEDNSRISWSKLSSFIAESLLAVTKTVFLCLTALILGVLPGRGRGYFWPPYRNQVFGPENSVHFTDPYTFLHFEDGIISYLLVGWIGQPDNPMGLPEDLRLFWYNIGGLSLGLLAGYIFEVVENSDYVINRFVRDHGTSQFYKGDSQINVFGDILALGIGYSMTKVCTDYGLWWFPIVWLISSEIIGALTFRDNLVLGFIQSFYPQDWIKQYQQEIVPDHLKGIMRAGYWDNKVRDTPEQFIDKIQKVNPSLQNLMFTKYSPYSHKDLYISRRYWSDVTHTIRRM